MQHLKFLQDCRYDITEQIYEKLFGDKSSLQLDLIHSHHSETGNGKIYFDIVVEDTTLTIEVRVSIINERETISVEQ